MSNHTSHEYTLQSTIPQPPHTQQPTIQTPYITIHTRNNSYSVLRDSQQNPQLIPTTRNCINIFDNNLSLYNAVVIAAQTITFYNKDAQALKQDVCTLLLKYKDFFFLQFPLNFPKNSNKQTDTYIKKYMNFKPQFRLQEGIPVSIQPILTCLSFLLQTNIKLINQNQNLNNSNLSFVHLNPDFDPNSIYIKKIHQHYPRLYHHSK